jgi:hypothetical protein
MAQVDVPAAFAIGSVLADAARQDLRQGRAEHHLRALLATNLFNIFLFSWISVYFLVNYFGWGTTHMVLPPEPREPAPITFYRRWTVVATTDRGVLTYTAQRERPPPRTRRTWHITTSATEARTSAPPSGAAAMGRQRVCQGGAMEQHRTRGEPWDNIERS